MKRVSALLLLSAIMFPGHSFSATVEVTMNDDYFDPSEIIVNPGDTVKWMNQGTVAHTSTSGDGEPNGEWDSGSVAPGNTYERVFYHPGTYAYYSQEALYDSYDMDGTVIVTGETNNLTLTVSSTKIYWDDAFTASVFLKSLSDTFDAWIVVIDPSDKIRYVTRGGKLTERPTRYAQNVPGLPKDINVTILRTFVPDLIPGYWTIAVAILPAGVIPTSLEDARSKAIEGYFEQQAVEYLD